MEGERERERYTYGEDDSEVNDDEVEGDDPWISEIQEDGGEGEAKINDVVDVEIEFGKEVIRERRCGGKVKGGKADEEVEGGMVGREHNGEGEN